MQAVIAESNLLLFLSFLASHRLITCLSIESSNLAPYKVSSSLAKSLFSNFCRRRSVNRFHLLMAGAVSRVKRLFEETLAVNNGWGCSRDSFAPACVPLPTFCIFHYLSFPCLCCVLPSRPNSLSRLSLSLSFGFIDPSPETTTGMIQPPPCLIPFPFLTTTLYCAL